ncbi:MAG: cytidylate kinase-like family protein [Dehalococcoidia bacterium]|jgi:cytidylate kinase|nr:cytidylate kinase-like family protein [Dehalococcoidia bacterium]
MNIVTIEGRQGSGVKILGRSVAKKLDFDFIDRLILANIAKKVGSTVEALNQVEKKIPTLTTKFADSINSMLEKSVAVGMGGDPYFGPGIDYILSKPYSSMDNDLTTAGSKIDYQRFIDTTHEVIKDLGELGKVVIISRGGALILKDNPNALKILVVADIEDRIKNTMEQEKVNKESAEEIIEHADKAQLKYFNDAFQKTPLDPSSYHCVINSSKINIEKSTDIVVDMIKELNKK